jgi:fimbrial chaperone protein
MGKFFNQILKKTLLVCALVLATNASANFEFSPITISLTTTGKTNHAIAQVVNRQAVAIPIVIHVTERKLLENGEEERPDTAELAVYPSQFMLEPNETKSIKISWQGEESVPNEKSYRIIVEEVPVEFSAKSANKGAVRILINYVGSIYVNSSKTEGNLVLEKIEPAEDKKFLNFLFNNKGNGHAILKAPSIDLTAKAANNLPEKKIKIDKTMLTNADGKNILALSKLKIRIPMPAALSGYDQFDWNFSYEK